MDTELAVRVNDLSTLVIFLAGLIGALCTYIVWLPLCDPDCSHCEAKRSRRPARAAEMCKLHQRPRHECRDEEHE